MQRLLKYTTIKMLTTDGLMAMFWTETVRFVATVLYDTKGNAYSQGSTMADLWFGK